MKTSIFHAGEYGSLLLGNILCRGIAQDHRLRVCVTQTLLPQEYLEYNGFFCCSHGVSNIFQYLFSLFFSLCTWINFSFWQQFFPGSNCWIECQKKMQKMAQKRTPSHIIINLINRLVQFNDCVRRGQCWCWFTNVTVFSSPSATKISF